MEGVEEKISAKTITPKGLLSDLKSIFPLIYNILSKKPNYLILFITAKCNSRCKFCFNWRNIERGAQNGYKDELTIPEIYKIALNFPHLEYLTISGGEPFLRSDLPEIIYIFYRISHLQILNIPTNGTLPERIYTAVKKILEIAPGLKINIDISIDNIGEKHDLIRGFPGNFERINETIDKLTQLKKKHNNLTLRSSTVLSSYNQDDIIEVYEYLKENMDFDLPTIGLVRGNTREPEALNVRLKKYIELIKHVESDLAEAESGDLINALLKTVKQLAWELIAGIAVRKYYPITCTAGKKMLVIDQIGNVFPCEILGSSFGNLRDADFNLKKLLNGKKARIIYKIIKSGKCLCTFECAVQNSIVNSPKIYIYLIQKFINEIRTLVKYKKIKKIGAPG